MDKYWYIDPEEEEVVFHSQTCPITGQTIVFNSTDESKQEVGGLVETPTYHPEDSSDSIDTSVEHLREKLSGDLIVDFKNKPIPINVNMYMNLTPIIEVSNTEDDSKLGLNDLHSDEREESKNDELSSTEEMSFLTWDVSEKLKSLSLGYRLSFDDSPVNNGLEENNACVTPKKDDVNVLDLLKTPKSEVKADKDGGYLSTLSEIAIIQAELTKEKDCDADSSYCSCITTIYSTPSRKITPLKLFNSVDRSNNELKVQSEFKKPAQPIVSLKKQPATASKIPVLKKPGTIKKAVKSLQFTNIETSSKKKSTPVLRNPSDKRRKMLKGNEENQTPLRNKF